MDDEPLILAFCCHYCAWQLISERAGALGILERFDEITPPQDWSTGLDGGPRKVVREDQCIAGMGPNA